MIRARDATFPFTHGAHARRTLAAVLAIALVTAPPLRPWLEQTMSRHMLLQYPVLLVAGWVLARGLSWAAARRIRRVDPGGAPSLLAALVLLTAAMVPRVVDAAVLDARADAIKTALLLGAGALAALGWRAAGRMGQAFVVGNAAWMVAAGGLVLAESPARLCASYLEGDQRSAGLGLVAWAIAGASAWLASLARRRPARQSSRISTSTTSRFQLATSSPPTFSTVAPHRPPASIHGCSHAPIS